METSKKAQALKRQEIQSCTATLETTSSRVGKVFLELRKIANYGKDEDEIELISEKVKRFELELSEMKDLTARLKSLDSTNSLLSHYLSKIANWEEKYEEFRPALDERIGSDADEDASLNKDAILDAKISQINFTSTDPKELAQLLLNLSDLIDSRFKKFTIDLSSFLHARRKFEKGMKILKLSDARNNMLPFFEEKQLEWKKRNKLSLYFWLGLGAIVALAITVAVIVENS